MAHETLDTRKPSLFSYCFSSRTRARSSPELPNRPLPFPRPSIASDISSPPPSSRASSSSDRPLHDAKADPIVKPPPSYQPILLHQDELFTQFLGGGKKPSLEHAPAPTHAYRASEKRRRNPVAAASRPESRTLSRTMFLCGFLFPPFWIMGIAMLWMRPFPVEDAENLSPEEMHDPHRIAEVKWAKRCLMALVTLVALLITVIVAAMVTRKAH